MQRIQSGPTVAILCLLLGACSAVDDILPGERIGLRDATSTAGGQNVAVPIRLSAQVNHTEWTHRAGDADHSIQHPAFSTAPAQIWTASVGQGADRRHRITADPVAAAGRIFTLDSRAGVVATSNVGATLWTRDLTRAGENPDDASGGGLAIGGDQLFVTTGFGDLVALNAADGSEIWRQRLDAPATGAPTVYGDLVYVVTRDSRAWAINASNGRVRWQLAATPDVSGVVGGAGPAVDGRIAVFPFGSGEMVGALRKGGLRTWTGSVAGARLGRAYANVTDITGDPVLRGDVVYAGNASGRTVALDAVTGQPNWTAKDGATGPVWVDGGAVFLVSDQNELVRLSAKNGERVWGTQLPGVVPTRNKLRSRDVYAHYGPVLAGGHLWVASNDGHLRGFDPVDGRMTNDLAVAGGATTRPIIVDGTMYIVTQQGQLVAFR